MVNVNEMRIKFDILRNQNDNGSVEQDEFKAIQQVITNAVSEIKASAEIIEAEIKKAKKQLVDYPTDRLTKKSIKTLTEKLNGYGESVLALEALDREIQDYLKTYDPFDRTVVFQNIRTLMSDSGKKIGQIEGKAGLHSGYMSRLEKEDRDPSLKFVACVAKELDVTVDELLYGKFEPKSESDSYVEGFIRDLLSDTRNNFVDWHREIKAVASNDDVELELNQDHILRQSDKMLYQSIISNVEFVHGTQVEALELYRTDLPGGPGKVYIVKSAVTDDWYGEGTKIMFDIYLNNGGTETYALYSTKGGIPSTTALVNELVKAILASLSQMRLQMGARSIIEMYKQSREKGGN